MFCCTPELLDKRFKILIRPVYYLHVCTSGYSRAPPWYQRPTLATTQCGPMVDCLFCSHGPWELPLAGFIRVGFFTLKASGGKEANYKKRWGSTAAPIRTIHIITLHMSMDSKLDILRRSARFLLRILSATPWFLMLHFVCSSSTT